MILLTSQSPAAGFQPYTSSRAAGKNRRGGTRERREREQQESEGDSLVKWNKVKEEAWKEWQWVKYENTVRVENGGIHPDSEHRHPDCHWQFSFSFMFRQKETAGVWGVITYGSSDLSRQALSIPGNDIMASMSWLELGFWFLQSQKTNSQPQHEDKENSSVNYIIVTMIRTRSNTNQRLFNTALTEFVLLIIDLSKSLLVAVVLQIIWIQGWHL